MSSVIRVAAIGASALALMLYFAPSWASVLIKPTRPSLAAP